jgi:hypothetical protein
MNHKTLSSADRTYLLCVAESFSFPKSKIRPYLAALQSGDDVSSIAKRFGVCPQRIHGVKTWSLYVAGRIALDFHRNPAARDFAERMRSGTEIYGKPNPDKRTAKTSTRRH